jgi:hypothetical protein
MRGFRNRRDAHAAAGAELGGLVVLTAPSGSWRYLWVAVGSAGGALAARSGRLAWFPPAADIEPCMRFSRTRLPDVLHRWAFSVPAATAGWGVARRWFR